MKKTITFLLVTLAFFVKAQAELIDLPNGFVGQFILRQENNIFYVAANNGNELKFFRYNIIDNSVVEYTNQTSIPILQIVPLNIYPKFNYMHNGKFYQNYNNFILEFNDNNNTITEAFSYLSGNYPIKHNNIFIDSDGIRNLNTNILQNVTIDGLTYFLAEFVAYNNDIIALAKQGSGGYTKIVKINSNDGTLSVLKTAPSGFQFIPLTNNVYDLRQVMAGQYLLYGIYTGSSDVTLASLNVNNSGDYNDNIGTIPLADFNFNYFFNIGDVLYIQNYVNNTTKIASGTNLNLINIPVFQGNGNAVVNANFGWANGYGGNSFFKMNNKIYGLRKPNNDDYVLYETDGTEAGTILKNSATILEANLILPSGTRVYNNEAYFFNGAIDKVCKFDGTNFYKLYDLMANGYGTANSEAFYYNNFMFFKTNVGLVRLNLNQVTPELIPLSSSSLSTQENQKPTLKLYPNPTKSTLNFSEELTDIKIIDMGGKQISATQSKTKTISVEKLPKGNYLITGKNKNDKTISEKFIKQ